MRADLLIVVGIVALAVGQCDHPIFCEGEILRKVQLSGYFPDSKTFVDMPLKYDLATVLSNFNKTPLS
jgi:alpha,alpha-trehalase